MKNSLNETNKNIISDDITLDYTEILPKNLCFPQNITFYNFNFTYEKIKNEIEEVKQLEQHSGSVNSTNNINSPNKKKAFITNICSNNLQDENKNIKNNKSKNLIVANNINQTNGISNFSSNAKEAKNIRSKSYSKPGFTKNNNLDNLNNNKSSIVNNINIDGDKTDIILVDSNYQMKYESNKTPVNNKNKEDVLVNKEDNKKNNLQKNLYEKNKNKIKYNIPHKINKFINNKKNNNTSINNNISSAKTKDESNNFSEKNKNDKQIKLKKQSNGLNKNDFDYKSESLLLNTLNYKNIDKWDNSKDNGGDSIEEIFETEEKM